MSEFEDGAVINVEVTPKDNINVVIGDCAKIDAQEAITYIESGKKEIEKAVDDGINTFDANATQKTNDFNDNASDKTNDFNDNATNKTNDFNDNYTTKLGDFNTNATNKTNDFNTNATNKTNAFNDNAAIKQAAVDASAAEAKQWAIGDPTEPTGNSAKYWANQASSTLANCVTLDTAQTITSDKTFTNAIDGCFKIYGGYNQSTNTNQYKKLATCVISGTYQTRVIPFSYFRNASNAKEPRFDAKLVARVSGTAGTLDAGGSFIVFGEYPNFISSGAIDFVLAYKNNYPESNQVTVEFWAYVKNTYDGVAIQPFVQASGYTTVNNTQWTWGNPILESSEIPSDFSTISSEKSNINAPTPTASNSTTSSNIATVGWVNDATKSTNVAHRSGTETIGGNKTFSNDVTFNNPIVCNNATTFNNGIMQIYNGGYRMWKYKMSSGSTYEDMSFFDSSNNFLGTFRVEDTGKARFQSFVATEAVTPTEDNTTSKQIDTVGARNTKINSVMSGYLPTGTILSFGGSTAPTGFLLCDGSAVSRTTYADLYAVIGDTYGAGDGSTTFNVPNLQDKFLQGAGTNSLGTTMSAGLPNITGTVAGVRGENSNYGSNGALAKINTGTYKYSGYESSGGSGVFDVEITASDSNSIYGGSTTVQPPAVCVNFIIRI